MRVRQIKKLVSIYRFNRLDTVFSNINIFCLGQAHRNQSCHCKTVPYGLVVGHGMELLSSSHTHLMNNVRK